MYRSSLQDEADYNHAIEYAAEKATRKATASKAREVASYLISHSDWGNQKIAEAADLEESQVERIRREQQTKT